MKRFSLFINVKYGHSKLLDHVGAIHELPVQVKKHRILVGIFGGVTFVLFSFSFLDWENHAESVIDP